MEKALISEGHVNFVKFVKLYELFFFRRIYRNIWESNNPSRFFYNLNVEC